MHKLKKTLIGEIPEGWEVVKLKDVAKIRGNKTVKGIDKVAVIPMELVPDSGIFTEYRMVPIEQVKSSTYCEAGDILLAKITPSLENGKQGIVPFDVPKGFALATTEVFPIAPEENKIDRFFLFYLLKFGKFRKKIIASMSGTTGRQRASKKAVENLLIPLPPLPEQKKIAEILRTVDEAIEKTDLAIEKTERLKKGLMQRLLTKGIKHKRFKKTEIGEIPEEWRVVRLKDRAHVKEGIYGKRGKTGIIQLKADSIQDDGRINPSAYALISIGNRNFEKYVLKPGDILLSNRNSANLVGKSAIFRGELDKCVFSNLLTRIRVYSPDLLPEWLLYVLMKMRHDGILKALSTRAVNQALLKKKTVENLKIPLPPLPEQKKIAEILMTVDKKLELLRKRREKLERIKKGLMKDLLTGRRRVGI